MEIYADHPQVRISLLQQIISQKKQSQGSSSLNSLKRPSNQMLTVISPFYTKSRIMQQRCNHLKCNCRYRKSMDDYVCCKTPENLPESKQLPMRVPGTETSTRKQNNQRSDRKHTKLNNEHFGMYVENEIKKEKSPKRVIYAKELYHKMEKEIISTLFTKYGIDQGDETAKSKILDFIIAQCSAKDATKLEVWNQSEANIREVLEKVEKFVKFNLADKFKKDAKSRSKKKILKTGNRQKESSGEKKEEKKKVKIVKPLINIAEVLGKQATQDTIDQFITRMLKIEDADGFTEKLIDLNDALAACGDDEKGKQNLKRIISQFTCIIENQKTKKKRKNKKSRNESDDEEDNEAVSKKYTQSKGGKSTSQRKQVKRSYKKLRNHGKNDDEDQDQDQEEEDSYYQKHQNWFTTISITDCLEGDDKTVCADDRVTSNRLSIKESIKASELLDYQTNPSFNSKIGSYISINRPDNICEHSSGRNSSKIGADKSETLSNPSSNNIQYNNDHKREFRMMGKSLRKSSRKSRPFNMIEKFAHEQEKKEVFHTCHFKAEKDEQIRALKEKILKEENQMKLFMHDHIAIKIQGIARLRKENYENLIIQDFDSLLIKKKKLRRIKELVNLLGKEVKRINSQEIMQQLFAYIEIYEIECDMLIKKGRREKQEYVRPEDTEQMNKLMNRKYIHENLKFLSLRRTMFDEDEKFDLGNEKIVQLPINPVKIQKLCMPRVANKCEKKEQLPDLLQKQIPEKGTQQIFSYESSMQATRPPTKASSRNKHRAHRKMHTENIEYLEKDPFIRVKYNRLEPFMMEGLTKLTGDKGRRIKNKENRLDKILLTQNTDLTFASKQELSGIK